MLFTRVRTRVTRFVFCFVLCAAVLAGLLPLAATAQDAAAPAKPVTFLGTVQTLSGNSITVKNDAGATMQVTVEDNARLLRIEPGQKTLAGASPFSLSDLQAGDRVMARGSANPDGKSLAANMLVAIKGADIAQKQEHEREDWQKNGTGGLVKAVDTTAGTVTISTGAGATRTLVIHVSTDYYHPPVCSGVGQVRSGNQKHPRPDKAWRSASCPRFQGRRWGNAGCGGDCQRKLPESCRRHPGGERGCIDDHADRYRDQEACGYYGYT